jgi:hypothetical protein
MSQIARPSSGRAGALVVVAIIAALALGAFLGQSWARNSGTVRPADDRAGVITLVNFDGAKFCLKDDATQEIICGVDVMVPGEPPLAVGQHVSVTRTWIQQVGGVPVEVFVVSNPAPVPSAAASH